MISPLYSVRLNTGFHDSHMIYVVKVKVPKERKRSASTNVHNEMNDTKGVSNNTRLFLVIAQQTDESLKLHPRYDWWLH